ncbi:hypothetical protein [Streptomyces sp. NBC_01803]|uniref:hypothetical protein n=1 Tax=Streptomyces sp. NBC_01803 TaxID=2975946 RepID=UPI003FA37480
MSYRYVGRLIPVRDFRATVTVDPNPHGGTDLTWAGSFTDIIPGPVIPWSTEAVGRFKVRRLSRESEQRTRAARHSPGFGASRRTTDPPNDRDRPRRPPYQALSSTPAYVASFSHLE